MINTRHSSTRALILIMLALVTIGIIIARTYYRNQNSAVDPRVKEARELYAKYNSYAASGDYYKVISLLDSIESIYNKHPHYRNSYEQGVLCNNRGAIQLTIAIYSDSIPEFNNPYYGFSKDSLCSMAELNISCAIETYTAWIDLFGDKNLEHIAEIIKTDFVKGMDGYSSDQVSDYLEARSKEISKTIAEADRRLSVSYTNLGVIYRQREMYKEAIRMYEKALELWDMNLDAENNINALLGQPLKKRNFIQKLFPPDR